MHASIASPCLLVACLIGVVGTTGCNKPPAASANTSPERPLHRTTVSALGRVTPGKGVIAISGPVGEKLRTVLVEVGQKVHADEQLAETVGEEALATQLSIAREKLDQANQLLAAEKEYGAALVKQAELGIQRAADVPPVQIDAQQAEINVVQVQLNQAQRDLERIEKIPTSTAERDRLKDLIDRYQEQLRGQRAKLRMLEKEQDLGKQGAQNDLESAKAGSKKAQEAIDVEVAQRGVTLAEIELERASIVSPIEGTVLEVLSQPGELIGTQHPILTLGQTDKMYVVAEVYEADISRVRVGQKAAIKGDALPKDLTGVVEQIAPIVKRNQISALDPTARSDARVIEVRIRLDDSAAAAKVIGLQVDVTIDTPPAETAAASK